MKNKKSINKLKIKCLLVVLLLFFNHVIAEDIEVEPVLIGLDADMSSGSARAGEAIRRGVLIAINEINSQGGILGRPLQLEIMDHRGVPARGVDNIEKFSSRKNLLAVVGGLHSGVALRELKTLHKNEIIYLAPWAAATKIVDNNFVPNYVFRVSVRDEYAGQFLINQAIKKGFLRIGLLLERTGWGHSNKDTMMRVLNKKKLLPSHVQWFHWGTGRDKMRRHIDSLIKAGSQVILLVANSPEGITVVRAMAERPPENRIPIISHWGITGGDFYDKVKHVLNDVKFSFLQTYSFFQPWDTKRSTQFASSYCNTFRKCNGIEDIFAPVGTAHAYDLLHLLATAANNAGTVERKKVRNVLENIENFSGLVRHYSLPFTENHDALNMDDLRLARYDSHGVIIPHGINQ